MAKKAMGAPATAESIRSLAVLESVEKRDGAAAMEEYRPIVQKKYRALGESLKALIEMTSKAAEMRGHYRVRGGGANAEIAAVEFVKFARAYHESAKSLLGEVQDAAALAESASVGTMGRLYDEVFKRLAEWRVAGVFIGKFSRSLEVVRG
jgi:hypothetical protein